MKLYGVETHNTSFVTCCIFIPGIIVGSKRYTKLHFIATLLVLFVFYKYELVLAYSYHIKRALSN